MGIIINSDEYMYDKVLDISIVFSLGLVLLGLFYTMTRNIDFFVLLYSVFFMGLTFYNLIYISYSKQKNTRNYNILNFMNIYAIFLNVFIMSTVFFRLHR